jgi:hypothetical protein
MPFANSNDTIIGRKPTQTTDSIELVGPRFQISVLAADLVLNNMAPIGVLPAGYIPVGVIVDADPLDTNGAPALAMEFGIQNAAGTDISVLATDGGAPWGTGITVVRAGGQAPVYSAALARVPEDPEYDRILAFKVTAAAATPAAGVLGVTVIYRAA